MQITYKTSIMHLDEEPIDIGYASEKVVLHDYKGEKKEIGGHNGKTQLLITVPAIDTVTLNELHSIEAEVLETFSDYDAYVITSQKPENTPEKTNLTFLEDAEGEMGDFYGTRIADGELAGNQTKSLILISKDGAVFYDEFISDLEEKFNTDTLYRKIKAAQECYTGKGCH